MLHRLVAAEYSAGHTLWLRFADGLEGEVDLRAQLHGEIFEPLRDEAYFRGETLNELQDNLQRVIAMLLGDGEPEQEPHFDGVQNVAVA